MDVRALIVEQLERDGTLRTFRMVPDFRERLTVAFPEEYADPRYGPFHFLDNRYAQAFREGFAAAQSRRLGSSRFKSDGLNCQFRTSWMGIPTERNCLTYYALSFPEECVPYSLSVSDPHTGREYKKHVTRDDDRKRFTVYLECRSSRGAFDFELETAFRFDPDGFAFSEYTDDHTDPYGRQIDQYTWFLDEDERSKVQQFFAGNFAPRFEYRTTLNSDQSTHVNAPISNSAFAAHSPNATQSVLVNPQMDALLAKLLSEAENDDDITKAQLLMVQKELSALREELTRPKPRRSVVERALGNLGSIASLVGLVNQVAPFLPVLF